MKHFYKLQTKFEDTNPLYYINLTNIQSISIKVEHSQTNTGYITNLYLVVNGIRYLHDTSFVLVKDKMTKEEIEENDKKSLEFTRVKSRLEMIVQDIIEEAELLLQ